MIPVFPILGQQCQHQCEQLNFSHLSSESCSITKKKKKRHEKIHLFNKTQLKSVISTTVGINCVKNPPFQEWNVPFLNAEFCIAIKTINQ